jgi:tRNA threonylcarbamoyladenosine biosynthesis protein TsaB
MAAILCIETATRNCSVALAIDGKVVAVQEESSERYIHAEKLHPFISTVLEKAQLQTADLDAVCVSNGPGSYTGLRIGVSSAKGLCFGLNLPLISLNTTMVIADSVQETPDIIISVIDARREEVYAQVFDGNKQALTEIKAIELKPDSFEEYAGKNVFVVGDAATKTADLIDLDVHVIESFPSAANMAEAANRKMKQQDFVDVAYHEPFYLKDFIAGKPKKLL